MDFGDGILTHVFRIHCYIVFGERGRSCGELEEL